MKLTIGEYEVEIKAKGITNKDRFNKEDTEYFLNEIGVVFRDAGMFNEAQGRKPFAIDFERKWNEIYAFLSAEGAYDEFRK